MKRFIAIAISIIACLFVGYTTSKFQAGTIDSWYLTLNKSSLTPPDIVFPLAWGVLYVVMGISIGIVITSGSRKRYPAIIFFIIQLVLNFLWSYLFFYRQNPALGLVDIALLDIFVITYSFSCYKISRTASWLFTPYIIWLALATYLNWYIVAYN